MSFTDIFKTKPAEPTPAPATTTPAANSANPNTPTPAQPGQPAGTNKIADATPSVTPVESPGTAPNGVVPNTTEENKSPLDPYKDLWDTDPNAKPVGEYIPEQIDPAKLQEVMGKVDMTSVITPDNLAKIRAGGEDATAALVESMNSVAQQTLIQSTLVNNKVVENAVDKALKAQAAQLPQLIKQLTLSNTMTDTNPIYSDPAVKPVIEAVQSQLATKYPQATPTELAGMAQDFVKAMSESFNPVTTPETKIPAAEDWSSFFE